MRSNLNNPLFITLIIKFIYVCCILTKFINKIHLCILYWMVEQSPPFIRKSCNSLLVE